MKNKLLLYIFLLILAASSPFTVSASSDGINPDFTIDSSSKTVREGEEFDIVIGASKVDSLYGFEMYISFSSQEIIYANKYETELEGYSVTPKVENDKLTFAFTKIGNAKPEEGDISLCSFAFRGSNNGQAIVKLETVSILDNDLTIYSYTPNKSVEISVNKDNADSISTPAPTLTPEPSSVSDPKTGDDGVPTKWIIVLAVSFLTLLILAGWKLKVIKV